MQVKVNSQEESYPEAELSVSEIMARKRYTFQHVITHVNGRLVERQDRDAAMVRDGDELEVFHLIGGG